MIKDFYIFRHGETDMNLQKRWQGQKFDLELNENGLKQAKDLAESLKNLGIEAVFSSPLKRARKTAEIVSREINSKLYIKENLKEGSFGVAEGLTSAECAIRYEKEFHKWISFDEAYLDDCFEGGETKREMLSRIFGVLDEMLNEKYKVMAISAHGSLIINLMSKVGLELKSIPNISVFHVRYENDKWTYVG